MAFRAFSPDLPRCSVVHTNLLVVRQPAVNSFVFRGIRSPATAIDSEVSKSRQRRFKIKILSEYKPVLMLISACVASFSELSASDEICVAD